MNDHPAKPSSERTDEAEGETIRTGSPFAADSQPVVKGAEIAQRKKVEAFYDVGPLRYTAMGAVAAAIMVVGFAALACWWFPTGGVLIAALGCGLSVFGMASVYRVTSIGLLVVHLGLFLLSYGRTIG